MTQSRAIESNKSSDTRAARGYRQAMDALPFTPIALVARAPARNVARCWSVVAARDLFGHILVETRWGRIGARGRTLVRSFAREEEAARYVRALLARRRGAARRIGVAYADAGAGGTGRSSTA